MDEELYNSLIDKVQDLFLHERKPTLERETAKIVVLIDTLSTVVAMAYIKLRLKSYEDFQGRMHKFAGDFEKILLDKYKKAMELEL